MTRRGISVWFAVFVLTIPGVASAQGPPRLPEKPGYALLPEFAYADDDAARAVWQPMYETAPVSVVKAGARPLLRLPCNLAGTEMSRASWDWSVDRDLSRCRGLQFRFYCADPSPVSYFSLYCRSGGGWYTATFSPGVTDAWNTIRIAKSATRMEDTPGGWGAVDTIRISGWRGADVDTECYLADFGLWQGDAPVAVLRQESAFLNEHSERTSIEKYTEDTAGLLDSVGLPYTILSDLDLKPDLLEGLKLVILPYCPALAEDSVAALGDFLERGGKLVSFYTLPSALVGAMGLQRGNHVQQERPGHFASIRPAGQGLTGLPVEVKQMSWNIGEMRPVQGRSRVAAYWYDDAGNSTGYPAILVSDNAAHMTHVLLSEDRVNKALMLLAMVGRFVPEYWEAAAQQSLENAGAVAGFDSFAEAQAAIRRAGQQAGRGALPELGKAEALRAEAVRLMTAGKHPAAIAAAGRAREQLLLAYCSVQQPEPGEHRAFWCHSAYGVDGLTWDQAIKNLADNGFTAILPNMLWGGTAYYKSEVLPVAPEIAEKGDQIEQCVAACKKYGVACHVWKVNWNMSGRADKEFVEKMRQAGRTQVMFDGTPENRWLCPSHPANQQLEVDSMVEVARKYDVDGVHFDYIRYPHSNACFCAGCRKRFEQTIGQEVENWPADVRTDATLAQQWFDFRRAHITRVVAEVSARVRKLKPEVEISAAVFRNWPEHRDTVGQDWKLWCDKGYLDFVCPMDYTPHSLQFENWIKAQLDWAGNVPCYPGIGMSCWPNQTDIAKLIEQITITRRLHTGGFTVFNYGVSAAQDMVPLCGKGITRK